MENQESNSAQITSLSAEEYAFIYHCRKEGVVLSSESPSSRFGPDATEITITDASGKGFTQCFKEGVADGLPYPAETQAEKQAAAMSLLQTVAQKLSKIYSEGGEHPVYTRAAWKDAIASDTTEATYWVWAAHMCAKNPEALEQAVVDSGVELPPDTK